MNTNITKEQLAVWIRGIKECAKRDDEGKVWWFVPSWKLPFSIVAGWKKMFQDSAFSDIFCCSASRPEYAMCIKIVESSMMEIDADFDELIMPLDKSGEVDDTCIPLEWDDTPEYAAEFFLMELDRIIKEHMEEGR